MPSLGLEDRRYNGLNASLSNASEVEFSAPETADEFARHVISAICHASVTHAVGHRTFERCMRALAFGSTVRAGFRHPAKAAAIDLIWCERNRLFDEYRASSDKLGFLAALPWIGPVTKHSLARRLGLIAGHEQRAVA